MKGAGVLAACSLIGKALGALYRLPLTTILGGEGMGEYQLVTSMYVLFFTLACGGLPAAVSRTVAADRGTPRLALIVAGIGAASGLAFALIFVALSPLFSIIQGNGGTVTYLAVAPAIVFASLLAGLRGYFQGKGNLMPTSVSQIIEQAVKLTVGLWLARILVRGGAVPGAAGALIGVSVSEIVASGAVAAFLMIKTTESTEKEIKIAESTEKLLAASGLEAASDVVLDPDGTDNKKHQLQTDFYETVGKRWGLQRGKEGSQPGESRSRKNNGTPRQAIRKTEVKSVAKAIIAAAVPVTAGALVMPLTGVADSFTVVNILAARGLEAAEATARYGLVGGTVSTLVNLPVTVAYAFAAALLPRVAGAANREKANREIAFSVRLAFVFSVYVSAIYVIFARDIIEILYPSLSVFHKNLTTTLLRAEAPAVTYSSLLGVVTAALQGSGKAGKAAKNLLIGGAAKVAVSAVSLYFSGVVGACVGTTACYAITLVLDVIELRAGTGFYAKGAKNLFFAAACGIAVAAATGLILSGAGALPRLATSAAAGAAVTCALCGKAFGREERARLPFSKH